MLGSAFRLLACDDHPPIRMALRFALQRLHPDADMHEVGTGRALLEKLAQPAHYDLLVLDMQLPDISGLELLPQVKASRPALPVLVLSADDSPTTIMAALERGASSYITKASPQEQLMQSLQAALNGQLSLPPSLATLGGFPFTSSHTLDGLTPRQRDVLRCLLRGMPTKQIGRELGISEGTVKDHTVAVFRYFNVRSRAMVLVEAQRRGIPLDFQP